jgi:hypothetical protein
MRKSDIFTYDAIKVYVIYFIAYTVGTCLYATQTRTQASPNPFIRITGYILKVNTIFIYTNVISFAVALIILWHRGAVSIHMHISNSVNYEIYWGGAETAHKACFGYHLVRPLSAMNRPHLLIPMYLPMNLRYEYRAL